MYSEQLEQLIKSVIADGAITDKERSVLHKKAAAEGIDEDEIDVYIDGLIVNSTKPTPQEPNNKRDLSMVGKVKGEDITYYEMNEKLQLSAKGTPIKCLYMTFVDVTNHREGEKKHGLGIHVFGLLPDDQYADSARSITIKTESNTFQVGLSYWDYHRYFEAPMVKGKTTEIKLAGQIDAEMLKQLCEAKTFSLSIAHLHIVNRGWDVLPKDYDLTATPIGNFAHYAQMAYRSFVDPTAFHDAEFQTKKAGDNMDEIARLLGANEKTLQAVPTDAPCYKQYRDITSNMTVIHVSDSKFLVGRHQKNNYHLSLKMHAAKKEGEALAFYFELGSNIPYSTDDEGERNEEFPLGLDGGIISISVGAKAFKLLPVTYSKELLSSQISQKDYEHNFFAIDDEQIKLLIQANGFDMTVSGGEGISISAKGAMMGSVSMPKKWVLAYNLLTNPADKERLLQEYHDSKISTKIIKGIKGLFGKK